MRTPDRDLPLTATHWGTYRAVVRDGRLTALRGFEEDADPSPIGDGMVDTLDDPCRIPQPMVREGWLEHGAASDRSKRGAEPFVAVSWEEADRIVAREIERVRRKHGNRAIYAGSYGWASAGRFHHAPSQLRRFLNCIGGHTFKRDTYSFAAGQVILPHILGDLQGLLPHHTSWPSIIEHTDLLVAFGGCRSRTARSTPAAPAGTSSATTCARRRMRGWRSSTSPRSGATCIRTSARSGSRPGRAPTSHSCSGSRTCSTRGSPRRGVPREIYGRVRALRSLSHRR